MEKTKRKEISLKKHHEEDTDEDVKRDFVDKG